MEVPVAVLMFVGVYSLPPSARWLALRGKAVEAVASLAFVYPNDVDARDAARQIHLGASHAADALQGLLYRANAVEAGHPVHAEADRRSAHDQAFLYGAVLSALRQALHIELCQQSELASVLLPLAALRTPTPLSSQCGTACASSEQLQRR